MDNERPKLPEDRAATGAEIADIRETIAQIYESIGASSEGDHEMALWRSWTN